MEMIRMDEQDSMKPADASAPPVEPVSAGAPPPPEPEPGPKIMPHPSTLEPEPEPEKKSFFRRFGCLLGCGTVLVFLLLFVMCVGVLAGMMSKISGGQDGDFSEENVQQNRLGKRDKIAVINISGIIMNGSFSYGDSADSEEICRQLDKAEKDPTVKAVIISLNTPGGEVTASDDIHGRILKLKRAKPVVALMNSIAASGGYYVAVACDRIVASRLTLTGSIGVIISTYNYKGLLDKVGVASEVYKSGEMKDMLNGAKVRSPKEAAVIQELVDDSYSEFVRLVSAGRKIPVERIRNTIIGDGRVLHGSNALRLGLVDQLGRMDTAVAEAEKLVGVSPGSLNVVRYRRRLTFLDVLFGSAEARSNPRIQLQVPGMAAAELPQGRLYFLAQEFIR